MLARRVGQPVILGYLLVGVVTGPYVLGWVGDVTLIKSAATIGITLLMFTLGLEVSFTQLRQVGNVGVWGGTLQIVITFAAGFLLGWALLGWTLTQSAVFGLVLSLSSTMVGLKVLMERGELGSIQGRIMIAMLILQDISVTIMLVIVSLLGQPADNLFNAFALAVGKAAIFIAVAIGMGLWVLPWGFGRIGGVRSRELFILSVLVLCLMAGFGTHILGLSAVFGAFVIGLVLRESIFAHQALAEITPLRDVFATLFFLSLGMLLNPVFVAENWATILLIVICILTLKTCIVFIIVCSFRYSNKIAILSGVGLFQIGEFSFVLAQAGMENNIVTDQFYSLIVASAVITMILTPVLFAFVSWLLPRLARPSAAAKKDALLISPDIDAGNIPESYPVLLAGYGRIGRNIAANLRKDGIKFQVIEFDPELVSELRKENIPHIYGDAGNFHILSQLNLKDADVFVITVPDLLTIKSAINYSLHLNPKLKILARMHSRKETGKLSALGDIEFVSPEYEASNEFTRRILDISADSYDKNLLI
ncbi:MAG: cation:proton antiporter [Dehalococcoidia bacterium]|nr:cation:proton antiporter [Dehalococcoidia bacterium]